MLVMILMKAVAIIAVLITLLSTTDGAYTYNVSSIGGLGRRFDGIGGLSGGGCTTRITVRFGTIK
jgi:galactosylceramidase